MSKLLAEWFWTDRWMGSSGFLLPMEARGIYREMLTQAWRRGARLPNNHEAIRRAIGATEKEWRRSWPLVAQFWRVDGDALVNDTQVEVYREAEGVARRASERGRRGAQAKHKHNGQSAQVLLEHKPPSPISNLQVQERTSTGAARRPVWKTGTSDPASFGLYCVIAREARTVSNREDQSDSTANIAEIFKTLCAQRRIEYAGDIAARAIAAVMREAS